MVDFKSLAASKAQPAPINPRDIFNGLPKPSGINDLYTDTNSDSLRCIR